MIKQKDWQHACMHSLNLVLEMNNYMNEKLHANKWFCLPEVYALQSYSVWSKCITDNHISYKLNISMAIIYRQE